MKIAFYVYDSIVFLPQKRKTSEFLELLLHHMITLTLFGFGYCLQLHTLGSIIVMMDCSDIFLSVFRLVCDLNEIGTAVAYFSLLFSWIYFRLYMLPFHFVYEAYMQARATGNELAE